MSQSRTIEVELQCFYDVQLAILDSQARYKIWDAGRGTGKSYGAAMQALKWSEMLQNGDIARIGAPNSQMLDPIRRRMQEIFPTQLYEEHLQPWYWDLANGGRIEFRSGEQKGGFISEQIRWFIGDEVAQFSPNSWYPEIEPSRSVRKAPALTISTPRVKNWFYQEWLKGQSYDWPDHGGWSTSSGCHPNSRQY